MMLPRVAAVGFVVGVLAVASACSLRSPSPTRPAPGDTSVVTAYSAESRAHDHLAGAARDGSAITAYTVNVDLTDTGFAPRLLSVPVGRPVQLVVRNRGTSEHHYHIAGMRPTEMLWLSKAHLLASSHNGAGEHGGHHPGGFLPYHVCTSRTGLCPTGRDVHAHADPRDVDVLIFTPTQRGTFEAFCPLHPEIRGTVVVF